MGNGDLHFLVKILNHLPFFTQKSRLKYTGKGLWEITRYFGMCVCQCVSVSVSECVSVCVYMQGRPPQGVDQTRRVPVLGYGELRHCQVFTRTRVRLVILRNRTSLNKVCNFLFARGDSTDSTLLDGRVIHVPFGTNQLFLLPMSFLLRGLYILTSSYLSPSYSHAICKHQDLIIHGQESRQR